MKSSAINRGLVFSLTTSLAVAAVPCLLSSPASAASAAATVSLVATSADGAAFDLDEYAAGDVTVQVTDSVAGAVDADDTQDLGYLWKIDPFDPLLPAVRLPATGLDVQAVDTAGEFEVPLPSGQPAGTYFLEAGLGANAGGTGAIARKRLLTVKVGNAAVVLDDADPLQFPAGTDHPVAGTLQLEDGTGLPGRLVDLGFTRGAAGTDAGADAGFVDVPPGPAPVTALQVTTGTDGTFSVVVSDPAETGQGTELGGQLQADTAATPDVGDAGATSTLGVDLVSETAPTGSTLVVGSLGGGTPGEALGTSVTITAPDDTFDTDPVTLGVQGDADTDRDPVEGQAFTLDVDHGFFTTGDEELPSVVGDAAGNLVDLGATLEGITDGAGQVAFQVAIERDTGFDDDGRQTATVTAVAGDLTGTTAAAWDSAAPFNGRVSIDLSPDNEQPAAVDPAVIGDRTYYEVVARDQFGNPVTARPVDLTYAGDLDDWDYSDDFVTSDLDRNGDVWVVSFESADIDVTGTWAGAPTTLYTDTAGTSAPGTADAVGTTTASFYEINFGKSSFELSSSATDVAAVGSAVTETVRVVDQLGNPVKGFRVQFFRFGPGQGGGEVRAARTTNGLGEASYTFVGSKLGTARITAEVTDGERRRTLTHTVVFGSRVTARLSGADNGAAADGLTVKARPEAAGARVTLFRVVKGARTVVTNRRLDGTGKATFTAKDKDGKRRTSYVAVVRSTADTTADETATIRVQ